MVTDFMVFNHDFKLYFLNPCIHADCPKAVLLTGVTQSCLATDLCVYHQLFSAFKGTKRGRSQAVQNLTDQTSNSNCDSTVPSQCILISQAVTKVMGV